MTIEDLKSLNEKIVEATLDYSAKKILLKERESALMLETNFEEVLKSKRATVGEKEAYILLQVKELKHEVNHALALLEKLKREYEIEKLNIKFQGEFLSQIATGAGLDDD